MSWTLFFQVWVLMLTGGMFVNEWIFSYYNRKGRR